MLGLRKFTFLSENKCISSMFLHLERNNCSKSSLESVVLRLNYLDNGLTKSGSKCSNSENCNTSAWFAEKWWTDIA